MKQRKRIRNARMREAYKCAQEGKLMLAMLYAYFARFSYPLSVSQVCRFNCVVKKAAEEWSSTRVKLPG